MLRCQQHLCVNIPSSDRASPGYTPTNEHTLYLDATLPTYSLVGEFSTPQIYERQNKAGS